jgi:hypothetical protein
LKEFLLPHTCCVSRPSPPPLYYPIFGDEYTLRFSSLYGIKIVFFLFSVAAVVSKDPFKLPARRIW